MEQIIGSEQMLKFGSSIHSMDPPPRIVGMKKVKVDGKGDIKNLNKDTAGLIRRPMGLKNSILSKIMSLDGLIPNALLAIVHFILILVIPIATPCISFLSISNMTTLQGDVYGVPTHFKDFFNVNRLNPWWDSTPYIPIFGYINLYVGVYLFFAYSELLSFYLTGYDN